MDDNKVRLVGLVERSKNEYRIKVKRKSGISDRIPIKLPHRLKNSIEANTYVLIRGRFKSAYIIVDELENCKPGNYNDIYLDGIITKAAVFDTLIEIIEIELKVKEDNIRCIFQGELAKLISEVRLKTRIRVAGQLQSKNYSLNGEIKTAYEVKVNLLEVV